MCTGERIDMESCDMRYGRYTSPGQVNGSGVEGVKGLWSLLFVCGAITITQQFCTMINEQVEEKCL